MIWRQTTKGDGLPHWLTRMNADRNGLMKELCMTTNSKRLTTVVLFGALAGFAQDARPQTAPAPPPAMRPQGPVVVSPEAMPDRRVAFRILAPQANKVELRAGDIPASAREGLKFT